MFLKLLALFLLIASMLYLFTSKDKLAIYVGFTILISVRILIE